MLVDARKLMDLNRFIQLGSILLLLLRNDKKCEGFTYNEQIKNSFKIENIYYIFKLTICTKKYWTRSIKRTFCIKN